MTPEALAALHARCFADTPSPWTAAAFAGLLADPACFATIAPDGFVLGRVAGPEAELLTLAVAPEARRVGRGAALLTAFETEAAARGAQELFLEVAVINAPARALYESRGYACVGRRPGYYTRACGPAVDALVLRKPASVHGKTI
jgi:[ribosomal protein S18]-alanine N-acetyltransferase